MLLKILLLPLLAIYLLEATPVEAGQVSTKSSLGSIGTQANRNATTTVIEYYNATLDHYFMTADAAEAAVLDSGKLSGWGRTGASFGAYSPGANATSLPVCRLYGLPQAGLDSHFYSAAADECAAALARFASSWTLESSNAFQVQLPDLSSGSCPTNTSPVYRVFNNRRDVNLTQLVQRAPLGVDYPTPQLRIHRRCDVQMDDNLAPALLLDQDIEGGGTLAFEHGLLGAAPLGLLIPQRHRLHPPH